MSYNILTFQIQLFSYFSANSFIIIIFLQINSIRKY